MVHWLERLLSPQSIAIVGVSERDGSLAGSTYMQLVNRRYQGRLFLVNPKYQLLFDQQCYPSLNDLPEVPDLVVLGTSGLALEKSFEQALHLGVGGMVMYASNHIEETAQVPLTERLKLKAAEAGVPVIGGNSMGFYNYDQNVFISFDTPPAQRPKGHIALIAHSGSAMTYLANNDERFCFNYVIASGQETHATVADYMDYLLEQTSTRVIAIVLEAVRNVQGFISALDKAQRKGIPVVITKLGRTEKSAKLAVSHSGAIAGDHDAFVALCDRYGVMLAKDIDELITTAMLFAVCGPASSGGLASMLDSGGMREQMIDLADDYGLRFAQIDQQTRTVMQTYLEYGLSADNPLDAMGALGRNSKQTYLECGKALLDNADTGLLTFEFEFRDGFSHYPEMFEVLHALVEYSSKPVIVINSFTYSNLNQTAAALCHDGIPVINGIDLALRSIKHLCEQQSFHRTPWTQPLETVDTQTQIHWKQTLANTGLSEEVRSLELLKDYGLPVVDYTVVDNLQQARDAASRLNYPVVLKTAEPGVAHKSDIGGVKLSIENQTALETAYRDLRRIGSKVLIMPMLRQGLELALGMKNDPQYGPMIIVCAGGILIELLNDTALALAPVNHDQAQAMLRRLKIYELLKGYRSGVSTDTEALVNLIVAFSNLSYHLADFVSEIDVNPVIADQFGCTIVDALVVPATV